MVMLEQHFYAEEKLAELRRSARVTPALPQPAARPAAMNVSLRRPLRGVVRKAGKVMRRLGEGLESWAGTPAPGRVPPLRG
jgi:hypothetical protein